MTIIKLPDRLAVPFNNEGPAFETKLSESIELNELNVNSLIDLIIKRYHTKARESVVGIYDLAHKIFLKQGEKDPELAILVEALFLFFHDLLFHLKKEEQILFPNIIQLMQKKLHKGSFNYSTFGVIKEYTIIMRDEHKKFVNQLEFLRQLTNDYKLPEDGSKPYYLLFTKMKEFENEMMQHIQLENDYLFPRAIEMDDML